MIADISWLLYFYMDNERDGVYIPPNYESQISFLTFSFKRANFIESGVLAIIPIFILYKVMSACGGFMKTPSWVITVCILAAGGVILFGINGINGTTLVGFLREVFNFLKERRVAYYNPRVKTEALPSTRKEEDYNDLVPSERLALMYQNFKNDRDQKHQQQVMELNKELEENSKNLFFQDDLGVVETPLEYMTSSERRKYRKEQKKKAKEERQRANNHVKKQRKKKKRK